MTRLDFSVRPTTMADYDAVDALLSRVYPKLLKDDYPPSTRVLVLPRISRAKPQLLSCGTYYAAVTGEERIVGAGGWTRDRSDPLTGHIRHVVADDRFLRQGIARAILDTCLASARARGVTRMVCWSTFTGEPFYAALGFVRQQEITVPLDDGITFPAVEMTRTLAPSSL
ncbi:GNAT family N-acetyltransferase [Pseudaestuariivita atlantica]|uniref:N-acetyltransferase domain-containing protein n=1 Tax=Pseudaestuariivita atlantica TaxID=1317121 RepID=A0A0L1JMD5_9RHOB|nr:GNAT family N-acetyltransferase [Pseudaestuariivita atlantica]KNG92558.1 hypothetical protein ATO11_16145 [Pseudaestuariivita atlantica]